MSDLDQVFRNLKPCGFWERLKFRLFGRKFYLGDGHFAYELGEVVYVTRNERWP